MSLPKTLSFFAALERCHIYVSGLSVEIQEQLDVIRETYEDMIEERDLDFRFSTDDEDDLPLIHFQF